MQNRLALLTVANMYLSKHGITTVNPGLVDFQKSGPFRSNGQFAVIRQCTLSDVHYSIGKHTDNIDCDSDVYSSIRCNCNTTIHSSIA